LTFDHLIRMRQSGFLKIEGIGQKYAMQIRTWQKTAQLSSDVLMVGYMVMEDAMRVLALAGQITRIEVQLRGLMPGSSLATTIEACELAL